MGRRRSLGTLLRGGTAIAVAMGVMNVSTYGYQMVAARFLGPQSYGAFAAMTNVLVVLAVLSLALQANAARRIAAAPGDVHAVEDTIRRVGRQAAVGLTVLALVLAPFLNSALRLESLPSALMIGLTAVPLTVMGYQAGVLQGERRWVALGLVYVAAGLGRLVTGTVLMLLFGRTEFWSVAGVLVGAVFPVLIGSWALRRPRGTSSRRVDHRVGHRGDHTVADLWRETVRNSHALAAFFALSNADIVLARIHLDPQQAGYYAAGGIMTKAVLFLPQFVVVLAFPSMGAQESRRRTLLLALGVTGLMGLVVAGASSVLSGLAMVFVGGAEYTPVQDDLWVFALLGCALAMLQLLVYSQMARQAGRSLLLVWAALAAVLLLGRTTETFVELVVVVAAVDAVLLLALTATSLWSLRDDAPGGRGSVGGVVPAVTGADGHVERDGQLRG